jgi:hypothetical protein
MICEELNELQCTQQTLCIAPNHCSVAFGTGIPQVGISHTVPVPTETVPIAGTGTYLPVISAVCHETRGIPFTRGYL